MASLPNSAEICSEAGSDFVESLVPGDALKSLCGADTLSACGAKLREVCAGPLGATLRMGYSTRSGE